MACSLIAPSHYLNQCWLSIRGVLWHSPESSFTRSAHELNLQCTPRNYTFIIIITSPRDQWINLSRQSDNICISKLTIICSDNGLSPGWCQAIIWTNAGILLIGHLGTNFSESSIRIQTFSFKKMQLKMSSAEWCPFCLGLSVLTHWSLVTPYCDRDLGQHWLR